MENLHTARSASLSDRCRCLVRCDGSISFQRQAAEPRIDGQRIVRRNYLVEIVGGGGGGNSHELRVKTMMGE